jgi:formate hydrogenlyase subunit 4
MQASLVFLAKVLIIAATVAGIESTMSKFRIFRVPDLLFTSFIVSVIAILIVVL